MRRWERLWPVVWSLGWGAAAASAAWHKWQAPAGLALGLALLPTTVWLASPRPWLGLVGAALTYSLMARWPHGSLCAPVAVVWWTARVTWDWAAGRPLTVEPAAAATLAGGLSWPWVGPLVGLLCLPAGWLLSSHTALPWTGRLSYAVDRLCQPWLRGLISSSRLSQPHSTSDWEQVVRTAGELDQSLSARSATVHRRRWQRQVRLTQAVGLARLGRVAEAEALVTAEARLTDVDDFPHRFLLPIACAALSLAQHAPEPAESLLQDLPWSDAAWVVDSRTWQPFAQQLLAEAALARGDDQTAWHRLRTHVSDDRPDGAFLVAAHALLRLHRRSTATDCLQRLCADERIRGPLREQAEALLQTLQPTAPTAPADTPPDS